VLSTPLIPIAEGVLVMPLIGAMDPERADQMITALLEGVSAQRAHTVILDVTGVQAVDAPVTDALVMAAKAARLLGAQVMLTGIKPHVAEMLVRMGADITGVETLGSLQAGVAAALRRR
jgi:rsbT co-antagonist protein RsbR